MEDLPEQNLFGHVFGRHFFGGLAMDDGAAFPLTAGDKEGPDAAFGWQVGTDAGEVGFLPGKADAGAGIDAVLNHEIAVIQEEIAELNGGAPFILGDHGKVIGDDQPTHFVFVCVHGR
jgi:hypothetical protein